MTYQTNNRYDYFRALGQAATSTDIDTIMHILHTQADFTTSRLVDFALGLVDTSEGTTRLHHYLFHGTLVQRNYAALYFKRRGRVALLDEAVAQGKIDPTQAYAQ